MLEQAKFRDLTQQVAKILHYDWEPDQHGRSWNYATLKKDDQDISLHNGGWKNGNRIQIYGRFPKARDGQGRYKNDSEITVTEKKDAAQIAKDIQRRFLPHYLEELAKAVEQVEQRNLDIDIGIAALKAVAKAEGKEVKWESRCEDSGRGTIYGDTFYSARWEGSEFRFEIHRISTEDLLEIIELRKQQKARKEAKANEKAREPEQRSRLDESTPQQETTQQLQDNSTPKQIPQPTNTGNEPESASENNSDASVEPELPGLTEILSKGDFEQLFQDGDIDAEELSVYTDTLDNELYSQIPDNAESFMADNANLAIEEAKKLRTRIVDDYGGISESDYEDIPAKYKRLDGQAMDAIATELGYDNDAQLYEAIQEAEHILRQRPKKNGKTQQQFRLKDFEKEESYTIQNGVTIYEQQAVEQMFSKELTADVEIPF